MNGRSPNFHAPRFSGGTPSRNHQQFGIRQPLYLQPNCHYMSPRKNRMSSPKNNSESPDFIPLGFSSPVRSKPSWNRQNYSNNSSISNLSSPPSVNSSHNSYSYSNSRHSSRGNFRGRNSFNSSNNSGSNSPHVSLYIDKECMKDPWAELEKLKDSYSSASPTPEDSEDTQPDLATTMDSGSDFSDSDDS